MKKISLMFVAFIFVFECFGQSSSKEVIYGTVRADGYQKITKSAMWAIRPEAKIIYEGGHPTGYTVVVLDQDYFVRFVDGENNQFDRNYIVFPKGSVVYIDDKTDQFYSAICGNKIEYIRPVNLVTIQTIKEEKEKPSKILLPHDYGDSKKKEVVNLNLPPIKEKKKEIKIGWVVIPVAMIVTTGTAYLLMNSLKDSGTPKDTGGRGIDPGPNSGD